jgi:hypothetical protein
MSREVVLPNIHCRCSKHVAAIGFLLGSKTSTLACLLPSFNLTPGTLTLGLQLVVTSTQFSNGLLSQKLLKSPLFDVLRLVFFELGNEGYGALKDRSFVLLTSGNNFRELVDAFIDSLSATALNLVILARSNSIIATRLTLLVIILANFVPLLGSNGRL